ncbi:Uncharacterised protein [Providencia stuartii]|nr:Uncharacterised protein [Providencia stuartii]
MVCLMALSCACCCWFCCLIARVSSLSGINTKQPFKIFTVKVKPVSKPAAFSHWLFRCIAGGGLVFTATQGIPYRVITFYFLRFKGYISPSFWCINTAIALKSGAICGTPKTNLSVALPPVAMSGVTPTMPLGAGSVKLKRWIAKNTMRIPPSPC